MSEDTFLLHYHGSAGRSTMKLGSVLEGAGPSTEHEVEADDEDAENRVVRVPWYSLAEEELLPDTSWWVKPQTKLQQLKAEQDSFYQVLRRSATVLASRQLLTADGRKASMHSSMSQLQM